MEHQLTADGVEFMRWLDGKDAEQYWDKDGKGEKVIMRSGWGLAQQEYTIIIGLKRKTRKGFTELINK